MSFEALPLEPRVLNYIETSLEKKRLPHALLFLGPTDSLQWETAREIAKALFCENKKNHSGCGGCPSCKQIDAGNHPDFRFWEPEEDSRNIKIDMVRQIISDAHLKPFQAPCKVFVIRRAEALNEMAQNALLKTLEEPPANTYLILLSHAPEKILPTVRSRTQALHFKPQKPEDGSDDQASRLHTIFSERVLKGREAKNPDMTGLTREEIIQSFDAGMESLRSSLLIRCGANVVLEDSQDSLVRRQAAERFSAEELMERIENLAALKEKLEQSANLKLALAELWDELG